MTQERTAPTAARETPQSPAHKRPTYLPALAFVGVVIAFQNLAIRSDTAPNPFLRPALSVTQAFRIPPEQAPIPVAPERPRGGPDAFSEADFSLVPPPGSPPAAAEDISDLPPPHTASPAPSMELPAGADPIGAAILGSAQETADPIGAAILGSAQETAEPIGAAIPGSAQETAEPGLASGSKETREAPSEETTVAAVIEDAAASSTTSPPAAPSEAASPAPEPSSETAPAPQPPSTHLVRSGDTLWSIARQYQVPVDMLRALNPDQSTVLQVGSRLLLSDGPAEVALAASADAPAAPTSSGKGFVYTVRVGDTLSGIAHRFEVPLPALVLTNGIQDLHNLRPGLELRIDPGESLDHMVAQGESLWSISRIYDLTVAELVAHNRLEKTTLDVGQVVRIPTQGLDADHFERILERRRIAGTSWLRPIQGRTTDLFGMRTHPIFHRRILHRGVDIAGSKGTRIRAARKGVVSFSGWLEGYGNLVEVRHSAGYSTRYAHCSAILVKKSQRVQKGDVIAKVGDTGLATAPHVHFEIRKNGVPVDPMKYL